ncbi:MAG: M1 family metallopeptidase [Cyclobacteriaceae bacterium]|nr:M1 family metallopeptidase [Cyclobacteriaceae bacterium]
MKIRLMVGLLLVSALGAFAQQGFEGQRFEQMGTMLPTPNSTRSASGAPGKAYWQQKADYNIEVELNDDKQTISGQEQITYTNNSPDGLNYLWLQLEQNMRSKSSDSYSTETSQIRDELNDRSIKELIGHDYDLGFKILEIKDSKGKDLKYTINKTMMRVDLPQKLQSGEAYTFNVKWTYNINNRLEVGGRSGMEYFPEDGNYLYTIAQFFPRMAVYDDVNGWQHKQFLGRGEFALPFGDYKVRITVPSDHIVAATGELQNAAQVLTPAQIELFEKSKTSDTPVIIVSQEEVEKKEKAKSKTKSVWEYHASNVRDFAFASSRKLIWDAMGVDIAGKKVMAMSYYPKEANPLYEEYSTKVVAHTLKTYSKYTIDYPYPVAISVEASNGMEYPMICFNYGRPDKNGTYSERLKHGMISVIIHEVGHNFFPMIINSDERQWTWMDEGLNSFVQYLAEQEWDPNYPSRRGPPEKIIPYMKGSKDTMVPIMTNSEQIKQFGNNGYAKPATALAILRETVMGPELFDYAFKEYANRWAFKHPAPADFFRTMEDASAVDLDWFWKGWFYTTDNVDVEVADVNWYKYVEQIEGEANVNNNGKQGKRKKNAVDNGEGGLETKGFSTEFNQTPTEKLQNPKPLKTPLLDADAKLSGNNNFYEVKLRNKGGLVMPVILQFNYRDGSSEIKRIPAEIWRLSEDEVTKVFVLKKELDNIVFDPFKETADVNEGNNHFPPKEIKTDFQRFVEE